MLKGFVIALTTSYIAWFFQHHETQALYPFDSAWTAPMDARIHEGRIVTHDGEELVVWTAAPEPGRPTLLYLPGNAGALSDRSDRFADILDAGFGLTALAYRGSSGSSGQPSEAALTADGLMIASRLDDLESPLILYGESLGAALAVKLAAAGHGAALVLEAPFTTLPELVAVQYPDEQLGHVVNEIWNSRAQIRFVEIPLMVVHGREDHLVPQQMGRAIFEAARAREKIFFDAGPRGHSELWGPETRAAIFAFAAAR